MGKNNGFATKEFELEEPNITLSGLHIWVKGFSLSNEEDRNSIYLDIDIKCTTSSSQVHIGGPILRLQDLNLWIAETRSLDAGEKIECSIGTDNGAFQCDLQHQESGKFKAKIAIATRLASERHQYLFELDRNYLKSFLAQCESTITKINSLSSRS